MANAKRGYELLNEAYKRNDPRRSLPVLEELSGTGRPCASTFT